MQRQKAPLASSPSASGIQQQVNRVRGPLLGASPGCDLSGGSGPSATCPGVGRIQFLADEGLRSPSFLQAAGRPGTAQLGRPPSGPCHAAPPEATHSVAAGFSQASRRRLRDRARPWVTDKCRALPILSSTNSPLRSQPHRTKPVSSDSQSTSGEIGEGVLRGSARQTLRFSHPGKRPVMAAGPMIHQAQETRCLVAQCWGPRKCLNFSYNRKGKNE